MNWLDRVIAWLDPRAGLQRARARAATAHLQKFAYEGARDTRRTEGWIAADTSANAEIGVALSNLRKRSRDLVRNNSYAARAIGEIVGHAIGTGITAQARTENPELSKLINRAWEPWTEECDADGQLDFYGLQDLVGRTVFESGECLLRYRMRRPGDGLAVPLQLQVLEPDFLDLSKTEKLKTGYIIQGVEFDQVGRRVAYWLFGDHPGDTLQVTSRGSLVSARVPASEVVHVYRKYRPGQVRGVPWLGPVIVKLRDLDEYEEAELVRKKIAACFAAFVTQPEGPEGPLIAPSATDAATGHRVESFEPGMIEYLKHGEDIKFGTPSDAGGYRDYVNTNQATIAAGLGLTYEQLTGDLSRVNYSSYRAGHLSFRNGIEAFRWLSFIPMACRSVRRRFVETAFAAGVIPELAYQTEWTPPSFGSVDPLKDALAVLAEIRMGRMTWEQGVAELGYDPAAQLEAIERMNKEWDRRGITLDCDPRKVAKTGVAQQKGDNDGQAEGSRPAA